MPVKYKLGTGDTVDMTAITKTNQGAGSGLDSDKVDGREPGQANGLATLDAGSKVPSAQLPALALTDVWVVASEAAQLALTAEEGDMAIRSDLNKSYVHNGGTAGTMADWSELLTPTDAVLSVFGRVGAVVAAINDYTWAQIDKTVSSLADIATKSHTLLTDIGTNTHAQIDTHLGASAPHSGHVAHSLATAVDDFLVASGAGVFVKKTLAEVKTILGLGSAAYTASTDYATAAQGTEKGEGHITIDPWNYNAVIAGTWGAIYQGAGVQYPGDWTVRNSSATNLDEVDYKVYLAPGTYTFQLVCMKNTDRGIIDLLIDGSSAGTMDTYAASLMYNVKAAVAGIVISTGGLKTLSIKINGKHASSTGYMIDVSRMAIWRTA